MNVPVELPLPPMLAKLVRELPADGFLYEPKWDGFRALAFRDGDEIDLRSRHGRPLARYFPELVDALRTVEARTFVLDGEILAKAGDAFDFQSLLTRIHPAASRVERLRHEFPAAFAVFDVLAVGSEDLRGQPFEVRRRILGELLADASDPLFITPLTDDRAQAERWLNGAGQSGVDGVIAKHETLRYEAGVRAMLKVKREQSADCVVGGFRWLVDRPLPSSLLLGLYDDEGRLQHVGVASSFRETQRRELVEVLRPHVVELAGHPWEHGFLVGGSAIGRLRGAAGRWTPDMVQDWVPLEPVLVCEVTYDHVDRDRFRHPARFRRWRPDRDPRSCTFEQLR